MATPFHQPIEDLYLPDRVNHNVDILLRARTAVAIFSGSCAGILGLTNLWGLAVFLVGAILADAALLQIACGHAPERLLPKAARDFFSFSSLTTAWLTFVMAWIIFYNVLYVF